MFRIQLEPSQERGRPFFAVSNRPAHWAERKFNVWARLPEKTFFQARETPFWVSGDEMEEGGKGGKPAGSGGRSSAEVLAASSSPISQESTASSSGGTSKGEGGADVGGWGGRWEQPGQHTAFGKGNASVLVFPLPHCNSAQLARSPEVEGFPMR